jgi:hypothetical protein
MSFNVLNQAFIDLIRNQGLNGSTLRRMPDATRTQENIQIILSSLQTHSVGITALQEVGLHFYFELHRQIDRTRYQLLHITNAGNPLDMGVIILDNQQFTLQQEHPALAYERPPGGLNKYIHHLTLIHTATGTQFDLINTHAEFQRQDQLVQFMNHLATPALVMGDLNLSLGEAQANFPNNAGYTVLTPLSYSHVNTQMRLETYDHMITRGADFALQNDPELENFARRTFSLSNRP